MNGKREERLNYWSALIKEAYGSDENIKNWLEKRGITRSQFYYWTKQVRESKMGSTEFGPVSSSESVEPSSPVPVIAEIHFSDTWNADDTKTFFSPEIMIMQNGYQVYIGNHFNL